jgi:hypothetical protein
MSTHNGKIGRLPETIREQVNRRLADGEPSGTVLEWLNALPEARTVVAAQFGGVPISNVNLSRWRTGGYRDWHAARERRATVRELTDAAVKNGVAAAAEAKEYGAHLSTNVSRVVTADLAAAARDLMDNLSDPKERVEQLCEILETLGKQRRDEHRWAWLKLAQERAGRTQPKLGGLR